MKKRPGASLRQCAIFGVTSVFVAASFQPRVYAQAAPAEIAGALSEPSQPVISFQGKFQSFSARENEPEPSLDRTAQFFDGSALSRVEAADVQKESRVEVIALGRRRNSVGRLESSKSEIRELRAVDPPQFQQQREPVPAADPDGGWAAQNHGSERPADRPDFLRVWRESARQVRQAVRSFQVLRYFHEDNGLDDRGDGVRIDRRELVRLAESIHEMPRLPDVHAGIYRPHDLTSAFDRMFPNENLHPWIRLIGRLSVSNEQRTHVMGLAKVLYDTYVRRDRIPSPQEARPAVRHTTHRLSELLAFFRYLRSAEILDLLTIARTHDPIVPSSNQPPAEESSPAA